MRKKREIPGWLMGIGLILMAGLLMFLAVQPVEQHPTGGVSGNPLQLRGTVRRSLEQALPENRLHEDPIPIREYSIAPGENAPEPDPARYGQASDPKELQWLLDAAEPLLEGQTMYFSADTQLLPGSTIHYYLDDTILAITWKQQAKGLAFTCSEVKLLHPSQFRRYLSGGAFGSGKLALTSEMAETVHAVTACSGDFYDFRRRGLVVMDGVVHKYIPGNDDLCFVDENGDLLLERQLIFADEQEAQAYVDEHHISFAVSFGPVLVKDGEYVCPQFYSVGEPRSKYARAAICQLDRLHYMCIAANLDEGCYVAMTMEEFGQCVAQLGVRQAYALDGGQTATVVMNNRVMNHVNYGSERMISDILFFASAQRGG